MNESYDNLTKFLNTLPIKNSLTSDVVKSINQQYALINSAIKVPDAIRLAQQQGQLINSVATLSNISNIAKPLSQQFNSAIKVPDAVRIAQQQSQLINSLTSFSDIAKLTSQQFHPNTVDLYLKNFDYISQTLNVFTHIDFKAILKRFQRLIIIILLLMNLIKR